MEKIPSPCIGINPIKLKDTSFLQCLLKEIKNSLGLGTELINVLDDIEFAYHEGRGQYYSTRILEELNRLTPDKYFRVLAITDKDLFIPILTYVYGEAQLDGRAAIISTNRLMPQNRSPKELMKFTNRITKEALHELGHTFGLTHCRDKRCIMHYCRTLREVDEKQTKFCFFCETMLIDKLR